MLEFIKGKLKISPENIVIWCSLLIAILSLVSFFHIVQYWSLTNETKYAYLTASTFEAIILIGILVRQYSKVGIILLIIGIFMQAIGNIYYSYLHTMITTHEYQQYQELFAPFFKTMFGQENDISIVTKRFLTILNSLMAYIILPVGLMITQERLRKKIKKENIEISETIISVTEPKLEPTIEVIVDSKKKQVRKNKKEPKSILTEPLLATEAEIENLFEPLIEEVAPIIVNEEPSPTIVKTKKIKKKEEKDNTITEIPVIVPEVIVPEEIVIEVDGKNEKFNDVKISGPQLKQITKPLRERRPTFASGTEKI